MFQTTGWLTVKLSGRNAHPDPFTIYFFLGMPPQEAGSWSTAPNLVGTYTT